MQREPGPEEVWADLEGEAPDLAPAPISPGRTAERLWRFEWPDPGVVLRTGWCATCRGTHVPDRETLDSLLRAIQQAGADAAPCTCDCCVVGAPAG